MASLISKLSIHSIIFFVLFCWINISFAQSTAGTLNQYLNKLPSDLKLQKNHPQKYRLSTNWVNRDLAGNATGKFAISGEYTRNFFDDTVKWANVQIAVFQDPSEPKSDTLRQEWMEGFTYQTPDDIVKTDFFKDFPKDETIHLLRTLIWDVVAFEAFAWDYFDQLKLNEPFKPSELENFTVQMDNWGTLKMKNLKLTWAGLSKRNEEPCALIEYGSFVNPVLSTTLAMTVNGRSLYWGSIWVSLTDKKIEYATMNEDVIMKIASAPDTEIRLLNIQREVTFEKIKE